MLKLIGIDELLSWIEKETHIELRCVYHGRDITGGMLLLEKVYIKDLLLILKIYDVDTEISVELENIRQILLDDKLKCCMIEFFREKHFYLFFWVR